MIGNRGEAKHHQGKPGDACGRFYLPGRVRLNWSDATKKPVRVVDIVPDPKANFGLGQAGLLDEMADIDSHTSKFVSARQTAQGPIGCKSALDRQNGQMSGWAFRDAFDKRYREYTARTKKTAPQIAEMLGVAVHTLNSWRRTTDPTKPPDKALAMAAIFFGCDVYEFMPDWGLLVGLRVDLSGMTDDDIWQVCQDLRPVGEEALSYEDRMHYIAALKKLGTVKKVTPE